MPMCRPIQGVSGPGWPGGQWQVPSFHRLRQAAAPRPTQEAQVVPISDNGQYKYVSSWKSYLPYICFWILISIHFKCGFFDPGVKIYADSSGSQFLVTQEIFFQGVLSGSYGEGLWRLGPSQTVVTTSVIPGAITNRCPTVTDSWSHPKPMSTTSVVPGAIPNHCPNLTDSWSHPKPMSTTSVVPGIIPNCYPIFSDS